MNRVQILGVSIDAVTRQQAIARIMGFLSIGRFHHVITPNNEMLVEATKNAAFREVLNAADLNIPDSTGLVWMARYTGQQIPERVTGVDTVVDLCRNLPAEHGVFLLGGWNDTAQKVADALRLQNPHLNIVGTYAGSPREEESAEIIRRINAAAPHLLLVAFGAPAQDLWIHRHMKQLPTVRVGMGIGGTFDFLAGVRKRAPRFLQNIGIEWLWRLFHEPKRIGRIFKAVVVFPWLVVRYGKESKEI